MKQEKNIRYAIKNFFSAEYHKLINYVHSYLNYVSYSVDAEDIIQDVALNIYTKASINEPIENLAAYAYRSIKNKIIDISRKSRKNIQVEYFDNTGKEKIITETIPDEKEEDFYKDEYIYNRMYDAMEQLKSRDRDIIIETEFNGRSFNDLSEKWNIPVGTLLARKHRALSKLQKLLQNEKNNYNS